MDGDDRIYTTIYTVKILKDENYDQILAQISANSDIVQINLVTY